MVAHRPRALFAFFTLALAACGSEPPPAPGLQIEPLPTGAEAGRPPPAVEAMLFGGTRGCREDADCESNACVFGACAGLVTADELWRVERIAERVRQRLALQPELFPLVADLLADVATREEMGLAFRGRTVRGLGALVQAPAPGAPGAPADPRAVERRQRVLAHLEKLLVTSPSPVAEVAAITLARLGDASGGELVIALTEAEREATALEALRVLGHARGDPAFTTAALVALLSALSPDLDLELQRAAIAGLAALADRRAIRPLATHLALGPEAIAHEVAAALRALSGLLLGPDPLAWDAALAQDPPPAPPPYTPRGHDSLDDIDLPTP